MSVKWKSGKSWREKLENPPEGFPKGLNVSVAREESSLKTGNWPQEVKH